MKISDLYIKEAVRIRRAYLDNLIYVLKHEKELIKHKDEILKIGNNISEIAEKIENNPEYKEIINEKLIDLETNMDKVKNKLLPYYENIIKIRKDTETLWNSIQEKYPDITKDELKDQIIPYLKDIKPDLNF
jgi:uncharacterized coiled-coil DUF342 family protein